VNTIIADKAAGLTAAYAISMALYERERSGVGQAIEVPMYETIVSFTLLEHMAGETFVPAVDSMGYERVLSPNRRPYRTKDGYMGLLPYTTAQWQRSLHGRGGEGAGRGPARGRPSQRSQNITCSTPSSRRIVATRTTDEWVDAAQGCDIPMTPVRTPDDLLKDPHLAAIDFFTGVARLGGRDAHDRHPVTFSRTPGSVRRLPPTRASTPPRS
jgi:crotonobetainyl-CoA:carnitine CoA-transferase CaiB-like acyl-CoA transferase